MIKILEQLEGFASHKIATLKLVFSIFKMEAKLAGLSVLPLIVNIVVMFVVLTGLWSSVMILIGYGIFIYLQSLLISIVVVVLLNLILLLGLLKYLVYNLESMSFKKTRAYFSSQESDKDERIEKKIDSADLHHGKAIKSAKRKAR